MRLLFTLLLLAGGIPLLAQNITVSGTVTDADDGTPLIGANVLVKGVSTGTVTDLDGRYSIQVDEDAIILFSYTGYTPQDIAVNKRTNVDVALTAGTQLNEVVVTALGISREKKALGYAVQELDSEQITRVQQPNLVNALQGQVAGVQVSANGGGPGQAANIIIRGINSLDPDANNQPLFVIDGIPISNETNLAGDAANRGVSNRAADINPQDIETMTVLKGGPATALYGLRAANGAVIITTKKGKAGKLSVDYTSSFGTEEVNLFPETQKTYTQGFAGNYDPDSFWPSWGPTIEEARQLDPSHPETIFNNFENAYENGQQWRNTLTFTGGSEKATFRTSLSHLDHEGVLPFSTYQNTSINVNAQYRANEKFSFGGGLNYIKSGGDRVFADRFNERLVYWAPQADVTDYIFENGTMRGYREDGGRGNNPIYGEFTNKWIDDVDRYLGNVNFTYRPVDFLSINYTLGLDQFTDFRRNFAPAPTGLAGENVFENNGNGFINETRIRSRQLTSNVNATAGFDLTDDLGLQVLAGFDVFDSTSDRITVNGDELDIFDLFTLNNAANIETFSQLIEYRLLGLYGDISLSYKNAIYLSITGRNDWSSALPVENRSFFYPSVSLGVGLSDLVDLPEAISYAKIRASYAAIGKDTRPYRTNVVYASAPGFPIDGVTGWTRGTQKGAPDLVPEQTTTYEFGADLRFLKNRIGLDITYYNSLSEDQIIPVPVSEATGFESFILNAGSIENNGIEAILNISPIAKPDFSWDMNINFTRNRNEVVAIRDGIEEIFLGSSFGYAGSSASIRLVEGQPYGNIYGRSFARYNPNPPDEPTLFVEDGPLLIGENGFPVRNTDQKILGNTQPDWFGAITNTIRYKNVSFSFMFDTRQGVQKYNQMGNFFAAFGIAPYTLNRNETIVFDGVLADGSANTTPVWLGQGTGPDGEEYGSGYYRNVYRGITENFVEDADWIRLRNVSLNYQLPDRWLNGVFIERASITLTGNNLWLDTPYSGFDPEGNRGNRNIDDGFGGFTYPAVRSYFVNLNVTF